MSKTKMRSKKIIIDEIRFHDLNEPNPYVWDVALPFLEVFLDIRDILNDRMLKYTEIPGKIEEIK